jgi:site-specific DNA recombinase
MRPMGHTADWTALVPAEAELLNQAAEQIDMGKALYAICAEWTAKGIPTPRGKTIWRSANLRYTLRSPRMVGKRPHDGALQDMPEVPAILPEDLWLRICEKLAPRQQKAGRREARQCSNIALCGICGLPLIGGSDDGDLTYECRKRPAEPGACGRIKVRSAYVDAQVDKKVVGFLNDKRRAEALLEKHKKGGPEMTAIDARYAELEDNKLALERAAFNPPQGVKRLPNERYWQLRAEIEREQEQLQRRRVVNREAEPLRNALKQSWALDEWQAKPVEYRRAIIKLVTERVEITKPARYGAKKGQYGAKFDPSRVQVTLADEA